MLAQKSAQIIGCVGIERIELDRQAIVFFRQIVLLEIILQQGVVKICLGGIRIEPERFLQFFAGEFYLILPQIADTQLRIGFARSFVTRLPRLDRDASLQHERQQSQDDRFTEPTANVTLPVTAA